LRTHRPAALAAILVPRRQDAPAVAAPAPAPAAPATAETAPQAEPAQQKNADEARRLVEDFQRAVAAGDAESIRSMLAPDVRYNGVVGVDAALDDQIWLGRGQERPRFTPPDAVHPAADVIRVESRFVVPFRDVAGTPGEVAGRAVWEVARRAGVLQIVAVDYDILPSAAPAPRDG
jgi:ketosteroid isomerase-like protein